MLPSCGVIICGVQNSQQLTTKRTINGSGLLKDQVGQLRALFAICVNRLTKMNDLQYNAGCNFWNDLGHTFRCNWMRTSWSIVMIKILILHKNVTAEHPVLLFWYMRIKRLLYVSMRRYLRRRRRTSHYCTSWAWNAYSILKAEICRIATKLKRHFIIHVVYSILAIFSNVLLPTYLSIILNPKLQ